MAITDDLRKTLTDPTPLYFAAGTADLAVQQAKKVPALVEQLRAEAPARIDAVRNTDPKAVQEKVTAQAKEAQATVRPRSPRCSGTLDTDLKKLGESAQDLALRGVGVAAEYAVKARETYEKVAEHGEQAVKTWRGEAAEEIDGDRRRRRAGRPSRAEGPGEAGRRPRRRPRPRPPRPKPAAAGARRPAAPRSTAAARRPPPPSTARRPRERPCRQAATTGRAPSGCPARCPGTVAA